MSSMTLIAIVTLPSLVADRTGLHRRPALLAGIAHAEAHDGLGAVLAAERPAARERLERERPSLLVHESKRSMIDAVGALRSASVDSNPSTATAASFANRSRPSGACAVTASATPWRIASSWTRASSRSFSAQPAGVGGPEPLDELADLAPERLAQRVDAAGRARGSRVRTARSTPMRSSPLVTGNAIPPRMLGRLGLARPAGRCRPPCVAEPAGPPGLPDLAGQAAPRARAPAPCCRRTNSSAPKPSS